MTFKLRYKLVNKKYHHTSENASSKVTAGVVKELEHRSFLCSFNADTLLVGWL